MSSAVAAKVLGASSGVEVQNLGEYDDYDEGNTDENDDILCFDGEGRTIKAAMKSVSPASNRIVLYQSPLANVNVVNKLQPGQRLSTGSGYGERVILWSPVIMDDTSDGLPRTKALNEGRSRTLYAASEGRIENNRDTSHEEMPGQRRVLKRPVASDSGKFIGRKRVKNRINKDSGNEVNLNIELKRNASWHQKLRSLTKKVLSSIKDRNVHEMNVITGDGHHNEKCALNQTPTLVHRNSSTFSSDRSIPFNKSDPGSTATSQESSLTAVPEYKQSLSEVLGCKNQKARSVRDTDSTDGQNNEKIKPVKAESKSPENHKSLNKKTISNELITNSIVGKVNVKRKNTSKSPNKKTSGIEAKRETSTGKLPLDKSCAPPKNQCNTVKVKRDEGYSETSRRTPMSLVKNNKSSSSNDLEMLLEKETNVSIGEKQRQLHRKKLMSRRSSPCRSPTRISSPHLLATTRKARKQERHKRQTVDNTLSSSDEVLLKSTDPEVPAFGIMGHNANTPAPDRVSHIDSMSTNLPSDSGFREGETGDISSTCKSSKVNNLENLETKDNEHLFDCDSGIKIEYFFRQVRRSRETYRVEDSDGEILKETGFKKQILQKQIERVYGSESSDTLVPTFSQPINPRGFYNETPERVFGSFVNDSISEYCDVLHGDKRSDYVRTGDLLMESTGYAVGRCVSNTDYENTTNEIAKMDRNFLEIPLSPRKASSRTDIVTIVPMNKCISDSQPDDSKQNMPSVLTMLPAKSDVSKPSINKNLQRSDVASASSERPFSTSKKPLLQNNNQSISNPKQKTGPSREDLPIGKLSTSEKSARISKTTENISHNGETRTLIRKQKSSRNTRQSSKTVNTDVNVAQMKSKCSEKHAPSHQLKISPLISKQSVLPEKPRRVHKVNRKAIDDEQISIVDKEKSHLSEKAQICPVNEQRQSDKSQLFLKNMTSANIRPTLNQTIDIHLTQSEDNMAKNCYSKDVQLSPTIQQNQIDKIVPHNSQAISPKIKKTKRKIITPVTESECDMKKIHDSKATYISPTLQQKRNYKVSPQHSRIAIPITKQKKITPRTRSYDDVKENDSTKSANLQTAKEKNYKSSHRSRGTPSIIVDPKSTIGATQSNGDIERCHSSKIAHISPTTEQRRNGKSSPHRSQRISPKINKSRIMTRTTPSRGDMEIFFSSKMNNSLSPLTDRKRKDKSPQRMSSIMKNSKRKTTTPAVQSGDDIPKKINDTSEIAHNSKTHKQQQNDKDSFQGLQSKPETVKKPKRKSGASVPQSGEAKLITTQGSSKSGMRKKNHLLARPRSKTVASGSAKKDKIGDNESTSDRILIKKKKTNSPLFPKTKSKAQKDNTKTIDCTNGSLTNTIPSPFVTVVSRKGKLSPKGKTIVTKSSLNKQASGNKKNTQETHKKSPLLSHKNCSSLQDEENSPAASLYSLFQNDEEQRLNRLKDLSKMVTHPTKTLQAPLELQDLEPQKSDSDAENGSKLCTDSQMELFDFDPSQSSSFFQDILQLPNDTMLSDLQNQKNLAGGMQRLSPETDPLISSKCAPKSCHVKKYSTSSSSCETRQDAGFALRKSPLDSVVKGFLSASTHSKASQKTVSKLSFTNNGDSSRRRNNASLTEASTNNNKSILPHFGGITLNNLSGVTLFPHGHKFANSGAKNCINTTSTSHIVYTNIPAVGGNAITTTSTPFKIGTASSTTAVSMNIPSKIDQGYENISIINSPPTAETNATTTGVQSFHVSAITTPITTTAVTICRTHATTNIITTSKADAASVGGAPWKDSPQFGGSTFSFKNTSEKLSFLPTKMATNSNASKESCKLFGSNASFDMRGYEQLGFAHPSHSTDQRSENRQRDTTLASRFRSYRDPRKSDCEDDD